MINNIRYLRGRGTAALYKNIINALVFTHKKYIRKKNAYYI